MNEVGTGNFCIFSYIAIKVSQVIIKISEQHNTTENFLL